MKKKIVVLLAAVCVVTLLGGCGTEKNNNTQKSNTETENKNTNSNSEEKSGNTTEITYNVDDYVELGEYKGLEITLGSYDVTEEDVKNQINSIVLSYPAYEDTDKKEVENGDFVNIDYEGLKDGVAFDGGTANGAILEIGSGTFIDGFEDGLIGKKVGEEIKLDLTFPENYQNEELAGQAVVFNVTVNKIVNKKDMNYDTLTDKYVTDNFSNQGYKNVTEFKEGVKEQLETSNKATKESDTQKAINQKLAETCKVNGFPEGLLKQNIDQYMEDFQAQLKSAYGIELAEYLQSVNSTEEDFNAQVEQYVTESLENQLILEAIAKKEKIEIDEKEFDEYVKGVVAEYNYESEEAFIKQFGEDYVRSVYISENTMKMLEESAKITYEEKSTETSGEETKEPETSEENGQEEDSSKEGEQEKETSEE